MRTAGLTALIVAPLLLAASGCAALEQIDRALAATGVLDLGPPAGVPRHGAVAIVGAGLGQGAVLGPRRVLTVAHVVGDADEVEVAVGYLWATARVVRRVAATPEALVELELPPGDDLGDVALRAGPGGLPAWVLCADGPRAWGRPLRPGDSGSPVISAEGAVVGLASGTRIATGAPVFTALPGTDDDLGALLVARRP